MDAVNTEQSVSLSAGNGTNGDSFLTPSIVGAPFRDAVVEQAAKSPRASPGCSHLRHTSRVEGGRRGDLRTFMSTTLKASTWVLAIALLDCK